MAAKSKNMNDVYYWIKDTVLTSLTSLEQVRSTEKLISNFYTQYRHKNGCNELSSTLERELMDMEFDFIDKRIKKNNE